MIKYDLYKNSEVEWIGEIPNHWYMISIKNLVSTKITDGPHESPNFLDEGVPFLSVESVQDNKLDFNKKRGYISREQHEIYSLKCKPQRDDVFIVKSGSTTGKSTIVETDEDFNIWSPLCIVRSNKNKIIPRFLFSSIQSFYFRRFVELGWSFGTQPNIGMGVIENIKLVVPPIQEQTQIVQYLDTKTTQIDSLIQKTQEKINLLQEKRTSLINHTVTKGLNPNVEMKHSRDEWIGVIPSHWEISRLDFLYSLFGRVGWKSLKSEEYVDDGYVFLSTPNIKNKDIDYLNVNYITKERYDESPEIMLENGDVLLVKDGSTLGIVNIVKELPRPTTVNSSIGVLKRKSDLIIPEYLYYFLTTYYCQHIISRIKGGMGVPHLFQSDIKKFSIFLPNLSEQYGIVEYLDKQTQIFDTLIQKEEKRIELLKEYRQSLISDVVTGKIKVTDYE